MKIIEFGWLMFVIVVGGFILAFVRLFALKGLRYLDFRKIPFRYRHFAIAVDGCLCCVWFLYTVQLTHIYLKECEDWEEPLIFLVGLLSGLVVTFPKRASNPFKRTSVGVGVVLAVWPPCSSSGRLVDSSSASSPFSRNSGVFGDAFVLPALQRLPKGTILHSPTFAASACSASHNGQRRYCLQGELA